MLLDIIAHKNVPFALSVSKGEEGFVVRHAHHERTTTRCDDEIFPQFFKNPILPNQDGNRDNPEFFRERL
jgi:hypothetical protein